MVSTSSTPAPPAPARPASGAAGSTQPGSVPSGEPNWVDQVTDLVVDLVDTVRDKTTGPILKGARGVVFGTVALIVLLAVAIVGLVGLGRALALIPGEEWIVYAALGALLCLAGFFFWSKRFPS